MRRLPVLLEERFISPPGSQGLLETTLIREELYDDILPVHRGGVSAFVTIIRGCDKFCTFCVVPRTRGRERSRPLPSILHEVESLITQGVKDVKLLGQNVDSYRSDDHDFADCLAAVADLPGIERVVSSCAASRWAKAAMRSGAWATWQRRPSSRPRRCTSPSGPACSKPSRLSPGRSSSRQAVPPSLGLSTTSRVAAVGGWPDERVGVVGKGIAVDLPQCTTIDSPRLAPDEHGGMTRNVPHARCRRPGRATITPAVKASPLSARRQRLRPGAPAARPRNQVTRRREKVACAGQAGAEGRRLVTRESGMQAGLVILDFDGTVIAQVCW